MLWLSFPCSNSGKNGNSWVPIPVTSPSETGTSTGIKMTVPSTAEEKTCKKNDVKARSLLLMALPNEHQLTYDQLQKLVSRLAILGVVTPPEDLNVKILRSLPSEWDTHIKVKRSAGASNNDKKLAFVTTSGASNTNNINTVNPEVSTATTKVNTASTEICTASFSDATVYAFLSTQPKGSQLVHEDLEQLHDDDLKTTSSRNSYDDLLVKLDDTGFKAATYKRGHKEYQMGLLRDELEKVRQEKEGFDFKIAKFDKSAKDLNEMLESQITDKSKKGVGYHAVPSPHPLIIFRPIPLDLSFSGLEEFKEPEVNEYGPRDSSFKPTIGCDKESDNSKENTDDSLEQHQVTDTETSFVKSSLKV
ncbi:hypothetical protein Tco_0986989 [Tanacetum coccineum]